MPDIHKSLRIGDLLVDRGLISAPQLRAAIDLQKSRCENPDAHIASVRCELGEILIELGFISRHQLKSNLSWQRRLKATTAMMVFVAPLLTAACGGGSGGSSGGGATTQPSQTTTSQVAADSSEKAVASSSVSSAPVLSSKSSSSTLSSTASSKSSSSAASNSSAAASSTPSGYIEGAVQLLWSVPVARENGDYLDITEIGGYDIRYKLKSETNYTNIVIKDGFIDAYYFNYLKGEYDFEIATFDKTGLYSKFIAINPGS
ncbi:MAG: hypothetical protein EOO53_03850 [Gammaproteobacteria bacterium]|nr:MAG: hypothetical protein EOO53_03850 [Gammaproteobacteria bacterium]